MAMSYIWSGLVILSFLWGFFHGNLSAVAAAALDGAQSALELSLSMAGILCLWSGVMEILNVCGLSRRIAALFRPLLRRLLPNASRDEETLAAVSANVSANLLGLGNAATPLGIQAARRMARNCGGTASDELCLLVVLNTASIQLLPTTVASVRAAFGSAPLRHSARRLDQFSRLCHGGPAHRPPSLPSERRPCMNPSDLIIPLLLAGAAACGTGRRVNVYAALTRGAEDGLTVLLHVIPALVGLLTAVSMFRASGAMDALARLCAPVLNLLGIPAETVPLMLVRPVSGSGALAVASDLMASHGPDSYIGRVAAVMLGSTETTFYTIAVYFGSAGIVRTRHTVPAALAADLTGFLTAALTVRLLFGP